jgi:hypothetical protein
MGLFIATKQCIISAIKKYLSLLQKVMSQIIADTLASIHTSKVLFFTKTSTIIQNKLPAKDLISEVDVNSIIIVNRNQINKVDINLIIIVNRN